MSKISKTDCEFMDIKWYGIDKKGNIAVFCSGGVGNVPEFVCESKENTEYIEDCFDNIEIFTDYIFCFDLDEISKEFAANFSSRGLYYFDSDSYECGDIASLQKYYTKISYPTKPLKYKTLPQNLQEAMNMNFMDIEDFELLNIIYVKQCL